MSAGNLYVQYGCGYCAPDDWLNYDASPSLRIQKIPVIGLIAGNSTSRFPANVKYGDIVKGLPLEPGSCKVIYCSHVLEHLSLEDFRIALKNTYSLLATGGVFRFVMPDLLGLAEGYVEAAKKGDAEAGFRFMKFTGVALEKRPKGMKAIISSLLGNSRHQWLWDAASTRLELEKAGFKQIRNCHFGDSPDPHFTSVESEDRFRNAVAIECIK